MTQERTRIGRLSGHARACCLALSLAALVSHVQGQACDQWLPISPGQATYPGADNTVWASTMWDPDGTGPALARLVVGGEFRTIGNGAINRLAQRDPATGEWSVIGGGIDGTVTGSSSVRVAALAAMPDGSLIVGGRFSLAGTTSITRLARWDGSAWQRLVAGNDLSGDVSRLAAAPNGDLLVVGSFATVEGVATGPVARRSSAGVWSNSTPTASTTFFSHRCVAVMPSGDVVVGTREEPMPGSAQARVRRWNGTSWTALGGLFVNTGSSFDSNVNDLLPLPDGNLIATGTFTSVGGAPIVAAALWNGSAWTAAGTGLTLGRIDASTVDPATGEVTAVGSFVVNGQPATGAVLRAGAWVPIGTDVQGSFLTVTRADAEEHFAGGVVQRFNAFQPMRNAAISNGSAWQALGTGLGGAAAPLEEYLPGQLLAGLSPPGQPVAPRQTLGLWDGSTWSQFGGPLQSVNNVVVINDILLSTEGDVIVCGQFTSAGGVPAANVASYFNGTWSAMGNGLQNNPAVLLERFDGQLFAGGDIFNSGSALVTPVVRWTGSAWQSLPGSGIPPGTRVLLELAGGQILAGGELAQAGIPFGLMRYDGTGWSIFGGGVNGSVYAAIVRNNGDLIVAGDFTTAGGVSARRIARWTGTTWAPLGPGLGTSSEASGVFALANLPNDDLAAGGTFVSSGSTPTQGIARWDGTQWSQLGSGLEGGVFALKKLQNGVLVASGSFTRSGNVVTPHIARFGCDPVACDSIDFNNDTSTFDPQDIDALLSVYSEGPCIPAPASCNDIDFNNDTSVFDPCDIASFLTLYAEGPCTPCGF